MISILLPTYNGERYIYQSIQSVINQTFKDFELLVGINGENDSTEKIISQFKDSRIKVFNLSKEPLGVSKTLNSLLDKSSYNYIAIQDDDDLWVNKKLETQLPLLKEFDVVGSQIVYVDELGKTPTMHGYGPKLKIDNDEIQSLTKKGQNQIANSSSIIKKSKILDNGGWDSEYPGYEDMDMWLKLMYNNCKFTNVDEILVCHRVYQQSRFNAKEWDMGNLLSKYK